MRVNETRCPFCGIARATTSSRAWPDVSRLSRAARIALGASLVAAALPACGKSGGGKGNGTESIAQPYGVPPIDDEFLDKPEAGAPPQVAADDAGTD